jgi:hypothetical protein
MIIQLNTGHWDVAGSTRNIDTEECVFLFNAFKRELNIAYLVRTFLGEVRLHAYDMWYFIKANDDPNSLIKIDSLTGNRVFKYLIEDEAVWRYSETEKTYVPHNGTYQLSEEDGTPLLNPVWHAETTITEYAFFNSLKTQNIAIQNLIDATCQSLELNGRFNSRFTGHRFF